MIVDQSRHVFAIQQPEIWWMNVKEMKENINWKTWCDTRNFAKISIKLLILRFETILNGRSIRNHDKFQRLVEISSEKCKWRKLNSVGLNSSRMSGSIKNIGESLGFCTCEMFSSNERTHLFWALWTVIPLSIQAFVHTWFYVPNTYTLLCNVYNRGAKCVLSYDNRSWTTTKLL